MNTRSNMRKNTLTYDVYLFESSAFFEKERFAGLDYNVVEECAPIRSVFLFIDHVAHHFLHECKQIYIIIYDDDDDDYVNQ